MRRYIISDTNFGHQNIIGYCSRPFRDNPEMDERLMENWNSVVGKDDLVYHLGDFALCKDKGRLSSLVGRLHGRIVLVQGNHDTRPPRYYLECGSVNATRKPIMAEPGVILMHEPLEDLSMIAPNYLYFFGHVHDKRCPMDVLPNCLCVSVERTNYRPIDFDEALKKLRR